MMHVLLSLVAYLLGSIPFGLIVSKLWAEIDIRQHGSGNIGMTNVMRTVGYLPGLVTLLLDGARYVPVLLARQVVETTTAHHWRVCHCWAQLVCVPNLRVVRSNDRRSLSRCSARHSVGLVRDILGCCGAHALCLAGLNPRGCFVAYSTHFLPFPLAHRPLRSTDQRLYDCASSGQYKQAPRRNRI